jgi:thymidylate kinase
MTSGDVLALTATLLGKLDERGVRVVHWKSNEHLRAALLGETDLDLFVDPDDEGRFVEVVADLGFLPMEPPRDRRLPGLESFLGFDEPSGKLVHLDVHYRVVLGEQLLKNHELPLGDWLLDGTAGPGGMTVPKPERELLVLYVRTALKTKSRQILRAAVKGGSPFPESIRREARWLAEQADVDGLTEAAASSGLPITAEELIEFRERAIERRLDWRYVLDQKRSVLSRMRRYERMPWYAAIPRRGWLRLRSSRFMRRVGLGMARRHLAFPVPVVAAVGADGSGKTRLTRDLESWLAARLVVSHVYFGQPKSGLVFRLLNKPGSLVRKRSEPRVAVTAERSPAPSVGRYEGLARYTEAAKWVWLALFRRRLARSARSSARRGTVVIAERYPLADFYSMETPMDGPRLQPDGPFARFEMRQYRAIPDPGLTIILDADLETLRSRKEDLTREEHIPKVEAITRLEDDQDRARIDVTQPYEAVLADAKRAVWGALSEGH